MKILLVNPQENLAIRDPVYPAMGLLLIGTMLRARGHDVSIKHFFAGRWGMPEFEAYVADYGPDIVGITMNTFQVRHAREITESVKKIRQEIMIVCGGAHPTAVGRDIFDAMPLIDAAVGGDGEFPMIDIAGGKELSSIQGVFTKEFKNDPAVSDSLDHVVPPDFSLIEELGLFTGGSPSGRRYGMCVAGSRGCPYRCNFCSESVIGNKLRYRDPESVINELQTFPAQGIHDAQFSDDTFNANKKWAIRIFDGIIQSGLNKKMDFRISFRANEKLVDEEILRKAKRAGVWVIFFGVESGNQEMLRHMGKNLTVAEFERAFKLTKQCGIKTTAAFMFGLAGDSEETMRDSIALVKKLRPAHVGFSIAIPLPGTEFLKEVVEKGHLLETNYEKYDTLNCVIRTDALSRDEILKLYRRATLKVAVIRFVHGPERINSFVEIVRRVIRKLKTFL